MKGELRAEVIRRVRLAKRLADEALVHFATGDEMQAEARRLVEEALAIEAGETGAGGHTSFLPARARVVHRDLRH